MELKDIRGTEAKDSVPERITESEFEKIVEQTANELGKNIIKRECVIIENYEYRTERIHTPANTEDESKPYVIHGMKILKQEELALISAKAVYIGSNSEEAGSMDFVSHCEYLTERYSNDKFIKGVFNKIKANPSPKTRALYD